MTKKQLRELELWELTNDVAWAIIDFGWNIQRLPFLGFSSNPYPEIRKISEDIILYRYANVKP